MVLGLWSGSSSIKALSKSAQCTHRGVCTAIRRKSRRKLNPLNHSCSLLDLPLDGLQVLPQSVHVGKQDVELLLEASLGETRVLKSGRGCCGWLKAFVLEAGLTIHFGKEFVSCAGSS